MPKAGELKFSYTLGGGLKFWLCSSMMTYARSTMIEMKRLLFSMSSRFLRVRRTRCTGSAVHSSEQACTERGSALCVGSRHVPRREQEAPAFPDPLPVRLEPHDQREHLRGQQRQTFGEISGRLREISGCARRR